MSFFNKIKNFVSPSKISNPEGNRELGKGAIVMPKMSAEDIRRDILDQNAHSADEQKHAPKNDVPQLQKTPSSYSNMI
jgi:hypothetical protein